MTLRRLRLKQVMDKVALPKSTLYKMLDDGDFPSQYKDGSSAFWFEHEIDAWLIKRHNLQLKTSDEITDAQA